MRENNASSCRSYKAGIKAKILALYGGQCCMCSFADPRALQLDHVVPPLEKTGEMLRGGIGLYIAILAGRRPKENFQLLCANCNWIKRHTHAESKPTEASKLEPFRMETGGITLTINQSLLR